MNEYLVTIDRILRRLQEGGYRSWDHYDFWGSKAGIALRRNRNALTLPVIGAAYLADVMFPMLFRWRKEQAIPMETLPFVLRTMWRYRAATGDQRYESDRKSLEKYMVEHLGKSPHGRGMGHQFDWYTTLLIPAFTPCVTLSSYPVDYFLETDPAGRADVLRDTGEFVFRDLNRVENGDRTCKVSYTALDNRWVINANSYAARILFRLAKHFGREDYLERADKLFRYVLNCQEGNGSWFYFEKGSVPATENFIDCFHSAFVLENLMGAASEGNRDVESAVDRGMQYFAEAFINHDGTVNHFAKSHIPIRIRADIRSCAETIVCCVLAAEREPRYAELAAKVYRKTMSTMYDGNGAFYFRDYSFFTSKMNYVRWGAGPMLNALTFLARYEERN